MKTYSIKLFLLFSLLFTVNSAFAGYSCKNCVKTLGGGYICQSCEDDSLQPSP